MKLSLLAPIDEFTGYGKTANEIARRLPALLGCQMVIRATRATVPSPDIAPMVRGGENDCEWELICHPATLCPTAGKKTIYVTVGESTRLPPKSVAILNQCEAVITHSNYCAVSFSASGVNVPIYVVPLGFNPEVFNYRPMPEGPFTFGCAGKLRNGPTRKGVREVIRLFQAAFPIPAAGTIIGAKDGNGCRPDNVRLKVKIFPNDPPLEVQDSRITVERAVWDEQTLANWMAQCHCWVSLATGGFELMPLQAMALGRPVISFAFGGITEYFNRGNGFVIGHDVVPATDVWKGNGLFAQAKEEDALFALRLAAHESSRTYVGDRGIKAMSSAQKFSWANFARDMASIIQRVIPKEQEPVADPLPTIEVMDDEQLTVAITSFQRGEHLDRAIKSAVEAGVDRVAVATMAPTEIVMEVLRRWKSRLRDRMDYRVTADMGCNELWLQAAYQSRTDRLIILHDDDYLNPELGKAYRDIICPALKAGAGFASWRGKLVWEDTNTAHPTEYFCGPTGEYDSARLVEVLTDTARLSLSPIVSVFRRGVLIDALKEAPQCLTGPDSYLHPNMLLGTEIIAYLRHCSTYEKWFFVNEVLSCYGAWGGSGTVKARAEGVINKVQKGYNIARQHWLSHSKFSPKAPDPRIIFVYNDFDTHSQDDQRRYDFARRSWEFHFNQGTMLEFPVWNHQLPRTSEEMGDARPVPFVKDVIGWGIRHARPEDVVVYANRDVILTTEAPERIMAGIQKGNGAMMAIRRNCSKPPSHPLRSVLNYRADTGIDVFAFTPQWWREHAAEIPDLLLGREAWDTVVRYVADRYCEGGSRVDDVFLHEAHDPYWAMNRISIPGQKYNRKLALEFFKHTEDKWMVEMLSIDEPNKLLLAEMKKRESLL